jgi:TonB family protein
LFVLLALLPRITPPPEVLAEVTWLDEPGSGAPASGAPAGGEPAAAPEAQVAAVPSPAPSATAFQREEKEGDIAPEPQSDLDVDARISERLTSLRAGTATERARPIAMETPRSLWTASAAGGGMGTAQALGAGAGGSGMARGGSGAGAGGAGRGGPGGPGLALSRGPVSGRGTRLAVADPTSSGLGSAPAREEASSASRTLAGALLMGEVADRPVLEYAKPAFPEWAKREAVEASVTLYFVVLPDGRVKENVRVERTAGYEDFDRNAQAALRAWRFAPLKGAGAGEQWGTITFRFQLRDA